jgi:dihydropteroate synthase
MPAPHREPTANPFVLDCRGRTVDARPGRAVLMGILNVTPDSFWDGGRYMEPVAALRRAVAMLDEGATIVDVGGASSRPAGRTYGEGAQAVSPDEETLRVVPVIEAIARERPDAVISIDTVHAAVASAALDAGAHLVNDVTGLRNDPELARVAAGAGAGLVLMHSVGAWGALEQDAMRGDVVARVTGSLERSRDLALEAGVRSLVLDPGFGFGKSPAQNLRLLARTDAFLALGHPVLVAVSRKSTIGIALGSADLPGPVAERLYGSLGATAVAVMRGASIIRTHDVAATSDFLAVLLGTLAAGDDGAAWSGPS